MLCLRIPQLVEFQVLEFGHTGDSQSIRATFQRAAVNHEETGGALHNCEDGFDAAPHTGQAAHFCDTARLQVARGMVRHFAGTRASGTSQDAWPGMRRYWINGGSVHFIRLG